MHCACLLLLRACLACSLPNKTLLQMQWAMHLPDGCSKLWLCFPAARCRPDHYSAEVAACLCRSLEPHFSPDCLQLPEDLELTESAQCAAERARLESQAAEFRNVLEIIETIGDGPAN